MIDFGMTAAVFRERYFERAPHLFAQALKERPFNWSDLDALLQQNEPTPQGLQLFHRGLIADEAYTEDCSAFGLRRRRLNKVRFYSHLTAGATLVLNRLELQSVAAQKLCTEIGRFAAQPATGNAYMSFRGDGTFGKHWDTHDVFAVQLIGRKRWRVFAPTLPLPLSHQTSSRSQQPCPDTPVLDCLLQAGDVLYIPRGWWHHAIPIEEGSLHLSVGTYAATVYDYVMWACSRALPEDVHARGAFQGGSEMLAAVLDKLDAVVRDPRNRAEFLQQIAQRERPTAEFNLGLFADLQAQPLNSAARVRLASCYPRAADEPLLVNGAAMQIDPLSARILNVLSATPVITIEALERSIPGAGADAVRLAVMNLNRHEIVILELP